MHAGGTVIQKELNNETQFVDFSFLLADSGINTFKEIENMKFQDFAQKLKEFKVRRSYSEKGGSNGYLNYFLQKLDGVETIGYKPIKNKNFVEVRVQFKDLNRPDLYMAYVYGFKNIQNLIRRIKVFQILLKFLR